MNLQQKNIDQLKASLNESNQLNQEIAAQVTLKKALFTSNIVLILVICILIISSIFLGYFNKTKYEELNQTKALHQIEKQNLEELKLALTLSKAELKKKYPLIVVKE